MIDERMEELAGLHVLGLLTPAEQSAFEAALERDPELRALVDSLRGTRDALVGIIPAITPPPETPWIPPQVPIDEGPLPHAWAPPFVG